MPVALSRFLCNRRVPNAVRNFPVNPGSAKRSDGKTKKHGKRPFWAEPRISCQLRSLVQRAGKSGKHDSMRLG